jgi:uncharacterized protein YigA (DUF484 family)
MNMEKAALDAVRAQLLADPGVILDDRDLMNALVTASDQRIGENVVDLRGVAMARLETRYDRLEDTHRSVIAAAYENISGTQAIHRAVLSMLSPLDFAEFLKTLGTEVAAILKVDCLKFCLETPPGGNGIPAALVREHGDVLGFYQPGSIEDYLTAGRNVASRAVTLRQVSSASGVLYGDKSAWIHSEALIKLDLGPDTLPAMIALGSEDPHQFHPNHGTDLLTFFGGVAERTLRRWLA